PVDDEYFAPTQPDPTETRPIVLFTGTMNHPPNVDAACFFARDVMPRVREAVPTAEFWIVGRDPTSEVQALSQLTGVQVTVFVPDIREYIARAMVVVVPLRFGSGMRNKILEAWGMEKCVVSTRVGAEGLAYEHGKNIWIADSTSALVTCVSRTLI